MSSPCPNAPTAPAAAVIPLPDYEPPAIGGPLILPPAAPPRPHRRPASPPVPVGTDAAAVRSAALFADAALRRVLEVLDRRRPLAQLRPMMAAGLVDSLPAVAGAHRGAGPARLRRVVAQLARPDGTAAEVAANYSRADRRYAMACRIEQFSEATGPRWRVVALHMS
ncbi:MAG: hypothetical protein KDB45_12305 [Mycobacterium sp.]|nr:hypothetical protein [Mycobacterium sp.]